MDRVYSEANVLARYEAAFPPHLKPRVRANLERFLELALEIDSGRYPSLTRFIARLNQLRATPREAPDEVPAGGGNRVRMMTIHAAKGLEAPVVILADTTCAAQADSPFRALVDWPAGSPRPRAMLLVGRKGQQDGDMRTQLEFEAQADRREQANLLYVALTRARQMLFISGCAPRTGRDPGWYGLLASALCPPGSDPTGGFRLESGTPAGPCTGHTEPPFALPDTTGLSGPLELPLPPPREVAPSRSVDEGPPGGQGEEDARLRGVVIHRILECLALGGARDRWRATVAHEFGIPEDDAEYRQWWAEACTLVDDVRFTPIFCPPAGTRAFSEVPVHYLSGAENVVHGVIDRLLVGPDGVWVIDYKSHRHVGESGPERLASVYREQLRLYAEAARRLWPGRAVRASLLFTSGPLLYDMDVENGSEGPH
jgi:ATP-dependent helicase/nuclease subunit A